MRNARIRTQLAALFIVVVQQLGRDPDGDGSEVQMYISW